MTNPSEDLLVTAEGVDEGSAASTAEGERCAEEPTGPTDPVDQGLGNQPDASAATEATPAPPVDMEFAEARETRDAAGPGQQLEAGEG